MKDWSASWQASSNPAKQKKYRENAPHHHRKKFLNARLADDVQETVGTTTLPVREGDRVEVMRGDFAGESGRVEDIDTEAKRIYVNGVEREDVSGADVQVSVDPSNVTITKLDLDDPKRLAKYEVSAEEQEAIAAEDVEDEDEEEAVEEADTEAADDVEDEDEEETADEQAEMVVDDLVSGTIDDVKDAVEAGEFDAEDVLEAEQDGKNRVTLVEWLESRMEDDN